MVTGTPPRPGYWPKVPVRHPVGTLGAALVMSGVILLGVGFVFQGLGEQALFSCFNGNEGSGCLESAQFTDQNDTAASWALMGTGWIVAGVGGALVAGSMISILARRERDAESGPARVPPPPPSGLVPGTTGPVPSGSPVAGPGTDTEDFAYSPRGPAR